MSGASPAGEGRSSPTGTEDGHREVEQRFIEHWGEMASVWGIPRTMGQMHALLYLSQRPLTADEIMERLGISRGNTSMSLRSLMEWGLVRRLRLAGERREFFESEADVWTLLHAILRERKKREFDPTVDFLRQCVGELRRDDSAPAGELRERMETLLQSFELIDQMYHSLLPDAPGGADLRSALLSELSAGR